MANLFAEVFERFREVGREGVAVAQQELVALRGDAIRPGVGGIGGAACGRAVGRVPADIAEGFGDGVQMAPQDFGEDAVRINEVAADGGGRHAQCDGEAGHGDAGAAEGGHEVGGGFEDVVFARLFLGGEPAPGAGQVVDFGAEAAGGDGYMGKNRNLVFSWASFLWRFHSGMIGLV